MEEIWKDIKGYNGDYQISNLGNVKSLKQTKERLLKLGSNGSGYLKVDLSKNNKCKTRTVHQLVAESFLGHSPNGMKSIVDHIDNNSLNNRVDNLQIITHRKNTSKDKAGVSKYTGVFWDEKGNKWRALISINNKLIHLGMFHCEIEASNAYQNKLKSINCEK